MEELIFDFRGVDYKATIVKNTVELKLPEDFQYGIETPISDKDLSIVLGREVVLVESQFEIRKYRIINPQLSYSAGNYKDVFYIRIPCKQVELHFHNKTGKLLGVFAS